MFRATASIEGRVGSVGIGRGLVWDARYWIVDSKAPHPPAPGNHIAMIRLGFMGALAAPQAINTPQAV
jgi:hypothetical protein